MKHHQSPTWQPLALLLSGFLCIASLTACGTPDQSLSDGHGGSPAVSSGTVPVGAQPEATPVDPNELGAQPPIEPRPTFPPGVTPAPPFQPKPSDPIVAQEAVTLGPANPTPEHLAQACDLIVTGRVAEILPAEWTTPDRKRPANPWGIVPDRVAIITPVVIEVDQGALVDRFGVDLSPNSSDSAQRRLAVALYGGTIGADAVLSNNPLYEVAAGQRVLLCLADGPYRSNPRETSPGQGPYLTAAGPAWRLSFRYLLTDDGSAISCNPYDSSVPATQLINGIKGAVSITATPGAGHYP